MNLKQQIEELKKLKFDWDGHGGLPIFTEVFINFEYLRRSFIYSEHMEITPLHNGTVSIELTLASDIPIYLEIGRTTFSGVFK